MLADAVAEAMNLAMERFQISPTDAPRIQQELARGIVHMAKAGARDPVILAENALSYLWRTAKRK